ncbi:MAG: tryptophan synthase subunit alpha [Legionellaceae bacterium]|nr:tryptophan synthase subunit alpha [Legionellaceae bacterium]
MIKKSFQKKPLFIPFLMAGHPTREISREALITLMASGCDIIELGVPFSDSIADGPVNQEAADIALQAGMTLQGVLALIKEVRALGYDTPILLFSYLNPLLAMGVERFRSEAKAAGVNGVLVVDLPLEAGSDIYQTLSNTLEIVLLTSPTTDVARLALYHTFKPAFVYYVSRCGTTGAQLTLSDTLQQEVMALRNYLPSGQAIAVGFGISTVEHVKTVARFADGVVVGSQLVKVLQTEGLDAFKSVVSAFSASLT